MDDETIYRAIHAAQRLRLATKDESPAIVSIHVGTDVWDRLRSNAIKAGLHKSLTPATLFGFPLVHASLERRESITIRVEAIIA